MKKMACSMALALAASVAVAAELFTFVNDDYGYSYIQINQDLASFSFKSDWHSLGNTGQVGYVVYSSDMGENDRAAYMEANANDPQFRKSVNDGVLDLGALYSGDRVGFYEVRPNGGTYTRSAFKEWQGKQRLAFQKTSGSQQDEWMSMEDITAVPAADSPPPSVSNVVARQRWPWNGLVDITCTVSGIDGTDYGLDFAVAAVMPDSSVHNATNFWVAKDGKKSPVQGVCSNGNYRLVWDARADLGPELYSNVVVRVTVVSGHARAQFWEGGPYWAMTNVGAEKPEDYGLYFWWGDTVGYRPSSSGTFDFNFSNANSAIYTFGKDIATLQSGNENEKWITADGVLAPAHDAAQAHWGGAWRMPTKQDLDDLRGKCDWVWTTQNGVKGWTVTGRGDYASASIFLPCAGVGDGTSLDYAGSYGFYWSSVPYSDSNSHYAWFLAFYSGYHGTRYYDRYYGRSVRPVQGFTE